MEFKDWPDCEVNGCFNKCCLSLNSKYCWDHTIIFRGGVLVDTVNIPLIKERGRDEEG